MKLTGNELAALMYVAREFINIDGNVADEEAKVFANAFTKFGLNSEETSILIKLSYEYKAEDALNVVQNLGSEQKQFASALVTLIIAADGKLTEKELEMYSNFLQLCRLPYLTIEQAIQVLG